MLPKFGVGSYLLFMLSLVGMFMLVITLLIFFSGAPKASVTIVLEGRGEGVAVMLRQYDSTRVPQGKAFWAETFKDGKVVFRDLSSSATYKVMVGWQDKDIFTFTLGKNAGSQRNVVTLHKDGNWELFFEGRKR